MDFIEARKGHSSGDGHGVALTIYDLGTGFVGVYPSQSRAAEPTKQSLQSCVGRRRVHCLYTDRAKELIATALALGIPNDFSMSGRPQTNGIVERQNQELKRGTKTLLAGAGLPPPFWHLAVACYAHHQNAQTVDGTSPWFKRFGEHFKGQLLPFGCAVRYKPVSTCGVAERMQKFSQDSDQGIFLGYYLRTGCRWTGYYLVASLSAFDRIPLIDDVPPGHCRVYDHVQVVDRVEIYRGDSPGGAGAPPPKD